MKKYIETVSDESTDILLEYYVNREYRDGTRVHITTVRSVLINFDMQSGDDPWEAVETGKGFHYVGIRLSPETIIELARQIQILQVLPPDDRESDYIKTV